MPVMNGLDMIEEVQKSQFHTRFVILTGYADFEYARKAIHLGVSDYLLKPIDLKTLDDILLSCLELQKSETRLLQKEYLQCALHSDNLTDPAPVFMNEVSCSFIFVFQGPLRSNIYSETIPDSVFAPVSPGYLTQLEKEYQVSLFLLHGKHFNEQVYAVSILPPVSRIRKDLPGESTVYWIYLISSLTPGLTRFCLCSLQMPVLFPTL